MFQEDVTEDIGVLTQGDSWFLYNVETKQFTRTNRWPLQPTLTAAQRQAFEMATDSSGQVSFAFVSPNNCYIVYQSREQELGYEVAIADLQTNRHVILKGMIVGGFHTFDRSFIVKWSGNSTAFTVQARALNSSTTELFHVYNFTTVLNAVTVQKLHFGINVGGQVLYTYRIFDISPDGNQVLLDGDNPNSASVILWDSQNPSARREVVVGGTFIIAAAYLPNDASRIRYIGSTGLVEYNLNNGQSKVLDSTVNNSWVNSAWFSPSRDRVALLERSSSTQAELYVVDFSLPTCTPTPTLTSSPSAT